MEGKVRVLGIDIDRVSIAEAVARCLAFIGSGRPHMVATPNAEMLMAARRNPRLRAALQASDLVVADGAGVVWAARRRGRPVPERVAGVDLVDRLLRSGPLRVYLLGATPESVAEAARQLPQRFPGVTVAGFRDGYFDAAADAAVVQAVRAAGPEVLLCGMGSPRQETWLHQHRDRLGVPLQIGIGGGIDLWAGRAERAPVWMQRASLEWLFRLAKQPSRWKRVAIALPGFILAVLAARE